MSDLSQLSPEEWAAASRLLDEALAIPAGSREAWLGALASREPAMADLVGRLLAAGEAATGAGPLSSGAPARLLATAIGGPRADLEPGMMVGAYRLVRPLGSGGMATVWLAEQTMAVIRQVALKIPHVGLETRAATAGRFTRERDLLAGLEHERIARLYDAGVSADGIPFLSMEWIDGVPINRYCDENCLSVTARITLFLQVLDAVAFAHARLVIHRDLKPSNILVTGRGRVKLLDFGVANLLSADDTGDARSTIDALTPDTASPEQLAGSALGTTSDVYSLGVILYELLTGHKPYALDRTSPSLHAALMATSIRRLSDAVTPEAAIARGSSVDALRSTLRGEYEAILGRCLAKTPADRYASVEALAADLNHLIRHEPVAAYGNGPAYRLRCLIRRQRWPLAAGTALLVALIVGAAATIWQGREAIAQAKRAEVTQAFLLSLFRSNTPGVAEGHEATAKDLLARGVARVDADLSSQPRALAVLHSELGDIYNEMGDDGAALGQLQSALAGFKALGLEDSREGLEALFRRGTVMMDQSKWDLARADLTRCLQRGRAVYGPRNRWSVGAREKLAFILNETDEPQAAIQMAEEALAQPPGEDLANDALRRLRVRVILGSAQTDVGDYVHARATLTKAVEDSEGPAGYSLVDRIVYRVLLTRVILYSGDAVAAEPAAGELVRDEERILGKAHPLVFPARQLWAHSLSAVGRYGEAIDVARATLRLAESQSPPATASLAAQRHVLAAQLAHAARYAEAEQLERTALVFFAQNDAAQNSTSLSPRRILVLALAGQHRLAEARTELDTALALARKVPNYAAQPDWLYLLDADANLDRVAGDIAGALPIRGQACKQLGLSTGTGSMLTRRCEAELAWLRAISAPGDASAAAAFESAAAAYAAGLPEHHVGRLDLTLLGAELDTAAARPARAQLASAREQWRATLGSTPPERISVLH